MTDDVNRQGPTTSSVLLGVFLIVLGLLFLAGQVLRIDLGHYFWPFFIIVPGALLYVLAIVPGRQSGEGLAIAGGIITATGVLLFYQNLTGYWQSWSYAWALVAPTSVGLALTGYGALKGLPDRLHAGLRLAGIGIVIFLIGAAFFELVIGIGGLGLGRFGWPLLLIGLGLVWLVRGLMRAREG